MHWVPMVLTDSGTLVGNTRDLFWMVTWKMICSIADRMGLADLTRYHQSSVASFGVKLCSGWQTR